MSSRKNVPSFLCKELVYMAPQLRGKYKKINKILILCSNLFMCISYSLNGIILSGEYS